MREVRNAAAWAAFFGCAIWLQGCGLTRPGAKGGGSDDPDDPHGPAPAPPTTGLPHCLTKGQDGLCSKCEKGFQLVGTDQTCLYKCESTVTLGPISNSEKKGLMMDDTTHRWCSDSLHYQWANTNDDVKSIRISKAWQADWSSVLKNISWNNIATFVHTNNAKALVGTSLSCDETADDNDWKDVRILLQKLGSANVLGVAVGNEMELAFQNGASADCVQNLWQGGYVQRKVISRIQDLDKLGDAWKNIKVTSVFGTFIFAGDPFVNIANEAVVTPFQKAMVQNFGSRYVFSLNVYTYFDESNTLEGNSKCDGAIRKSTCFDNGGCQFVNFVRDMRRRMGEVDGNDNELWITETGWSSPIADTLKLDKRSQMKNCPEFSELDTMQEFYANFLKWDMTVQGSQGPDRVFYFAMRDAQTFANFEHFGLSGSGDPTLLCENTTCKIGAIAPDPSPTPSPPSPGPTPTPVPTPRPTPSPPSTGACQQHSCGEGPWTENGKQCYCKPTCMTYHDCCDDYESFCQRPTPPPSPPDQSRCKDRCTSGKQPNGCWCSTKCTEHGNCCPNYAQDCPRVSPLANITAVM